MDFDVLFTYHQVKFCASFSFNNEMSHEEVDMSVYNIREISET